MKTSFTIIAYNEEKNIANCINSILNQEGLKDYEIVIVNDGSKDKTSEIVKKFSKENKNVKLIDLKENKGRGNARALGVKNAKGDYIAFVDADIILPQHWLKTCLENLKKYDGVGGIAVPDGDVNWIWRKFKLKPKIKKPTTELTGNNCFYKKEMFKEINFNCEDRDGEDFDTNERLKKLGYKLKTISIIVQHNELKDFKETTKWLYQSGKGASRLLRKYKKIRLPDLAFFGFFGLFLFSLFGFLIFKNLVFLLPVLIYPLFTSLLHIQSKFYFSINKLLNFSLAILCNYVLIWTYYFGRIGGVWE